MKMKAISTIVSGALMLGVLNALPVKANDSLRLDRLFDSYSSSSAAVIKTNGGTVLTGGEFTARFNRPNIEMISFRPPKFGASCGGIDMYAGSFGFMSKDEIVQVGRAVAQGAAVYFFNLAMDSICPTCSKTMSDIQKMVQEMNNFAKNACERTGQWLEANNVNPFKTADTSSSLMAAADDAISGHVSTITNFFNGLNNPRDLSASSKKENAEGNALVQQVAKVATHDSGFLGLLDFGSTNQKYNLANMLMTLAGTVTSRYDTASEQTVLDSLKPGLTLDQLLFTGTGTRYQLYTCHDNNYTTCPIVDKTSLTLEQSVKDMVRDNVRSIMVTLTDPTENLTEEQRQFQRFIGTNLVAFVISAKTKGVGINDTVDFVTSNVMRNIVTDMSSALNEFINSVESAQTSADSIDLSGAQKEKYEQFRAILLEAQEKVDAQFRASSDSLSTLIALAAVGGDS